MDYANNLVSLNRKNRRLRTTQKTLFEETLLLNENMEHIKWKITDEERTIAGYNCIRANGLLWDSVYVVAFYAEQIPISGGPESFNGLPGMILGLALPDEHVSWFATAIEVNVVKAGAIKPPNKGEIIQREAISAKLAKLFPNNLLIYREMLKLFLL
ncbi:MAG: GLPGLI family protein [Bacteroidota bacterium]